MSIKSQRVQQWRNRTKDKLVQAMGEQCVLCGYSRCNASIHLHHLDSETKDHTVAQLLRNPRKIELIIEEAKKCVLLCANCHGEVHAGLVKVNCNPIFDESIFSKPIKPTFSCKQCGTPTNNLKDCSRECIGKSKEKIKWPDPTTVLNMVEESNFTQTGDQLGVSDNAVRKYLKKHNLI